MRGYSVYGVSESGTATKTAVAIIGSTTARPALYDIIVGSLTTPADVAIRAAASRWVAAPGYELKGPASANNGIGVRLVTAGSAAVLTAGVHFFE
jgi:hypothetical protein